MSDVKFCTEKEVKDLLQSVIETQDEVASVTTAFRNQPNNSLKRTVTFVIQTQEGNEALVNKIVKLTSENQYEGILSFDKSEMIIQDGRFMVDFLYVEAVISPNLI